VQSSHDRLHRYFQDFKDFGGWHPGSESLPSEAFSFSARIEKHSKLHNVNVITARIDGRSTSNVSFVSDLIGYFFPAAEQDGRPVPGYKNTKSYQGVSDMQIAGLPKAEKAVVIRRTRPRGGRR
jgi:hypothetical protein